MDEPRAYYTEWSKSEREKQILYINAYIWNLERWTVCCLFDGYSDGCEMVPYHGFELLIFTCLDILKNLEGVNFSSPVLQVSQVQKRQRTFPSSLSKFFSNHFVSQYGESHIYMSTGTKILILQRCWGDRKGVGNIRLREQTESKCRKRFHTIA